MSYLLPLERGRGQRWDGGRWCDDFWPKIRATRPLNVDSSLVRPVSPCVMCCFPYVWCFRSCCGGGRKGVVGCVWHAWHTWHAWRAWHAWPSKVLTFVVFLFFFFWVYKPDTQTPPPKHPASPTHQKHILCIPCVSNNRGNVRANSLCINFKRVPIHSCPCNWCYAAPTRNTDHNEGCWVAFPMILPQRAQKRGGGKDL